MDKMDKASLITELTFGGKEQTYTLGTVVDTVMDKMDKASLITELTFGGKEQTINKHLMINYLCSMVKIKL
jgi:hypothetical protein